MTDIEQKPAEVAAEAGVVVIDGPGCIASTLTPVAAAETAKRLLDAAAAASEPSRAI